MSITESHTVENGVNVEALLGARQHMTDSPELAQFEWRAACAVNRSQMSAVSAGAGSVMLTGWPKSE